MSGYTTTIPAFVRTETGVVQLREGERLPASTLPTEYARLVAAGVVEEVPDVPPTTADVSTPDATGETPTARRTRGQSGSNKKG